MHTRAHTLTHAHTAASSPGPSMALHCAPSTAQVEELTASSKVPQCHCKLPFPSMLLHPLSLLPRPHIPPPAQCGLSPHAVCTFSLGDCSHSASARSLSTDLSSPSEPGKPTHPPSPGPQPVLLHSLSKTLPTKMHPLVYPPVTAL